MNARLQHCAHCGELIGLGPFYLTRPVEQPSVILLYHKECLETEAEIVEPTGGKDDRN